MVAGYQIERQHAGEQVDLDLLAVAGTARPRRARAAETLASDCVELFDAMTYREPRISSSAPVPSQTSFPRIKVPSRSTMAERSASSMVGMGMSGRRIHEGLFVEGYRTADISACMVRIMRNI